MSLEYDTAVYVGRFQPFHNGHLYVLSKALELASKVIVLIGSDNKPRSIENPFNSRERVAMIRSIIDSPCLEFQFIEDSLYDDNAWAIQVLDKVKDSGKTCIIGHTKDETSFYLKMFPQWKQIEIKNYHNISGTRIRNEYFGADQWWEDNVKNFVPKQVFEFLKDFRKRVEFQGLLAEYYAVTASKAAWANSPYPPIFVTVDAVVFYCGQVLLVKRKAQPGKGQWALPGGFIGEHERIEEACIRELYEETKIGLFPSEVLSMKNDCHVFDYPRRSVRGRTITHAYNFSTLVPLKRLGEKLPTVKGSDDAEKAKWFPINFVLQHGVPLFEDHLDIIKKFL